MSVQYYRDLLTTLFAGKKSILATGPVAGQTRLIETLRDLGATAFLLLADSEGTGDLPEGPDVSWHVLVHGKASDMMTGIRNYEATLTDLPPTSSPPSMPSIPTARPSSSAHTSPTPPTSHAPPAVPAPPRIPTPASALPHSASAGPPRGSPPPRSQDSMSHPDPPILVYVAALCVIERIGVAFLPCGPHTGYGRHISVVLQTLPLHIEDPASDRQTSLRAALLTLAVPPKIRLFDPLASENFCTPFPPTPPPVAYPLPPDPPFPPFPPTTSC